VGSTPEGLVAAGGPQHLQNSDPHLAAASLAWTQAATALQSTSENGARSAMAGLVGGPCRTAQAGGETVRMY